MPGIPTTRTAADPLGCFVLGPERLAEGSPGGPLEGLRFAVKDLLDVAGTRTGAGNPDWLGEAPVAHRHAPTVAALLDAGADLWGKTVTDELAFSLSGTNVHYGTPDNPAAPGRIPGGSSAGSASAVAGRVVDLALGTDTGGSIRVPASYCGIWGIRPTQGIVDTAGMVPLAPTFDTIGLLAANPVVLAAGWHALRAGASLPPASWPAHVARDTVQPIRRMVVATDLFALADREARSALRQAADRLADRLGLELDEGEFAGARATARIVHAFRAIQLVEAWGQHGEWITRRRPALGPGVAARFAAAAAADPATAAAAGPVRDEVRSALRALVGDGAVMVQPAASGPAPTSALAGEAKEDLRSRTLSLTAPAGMAGAPVVVVPGARAEGLPVGLALVGLPGADDVLVSVLSAG